MAVPDTDHLRGRIIDAALAMAGEGAGGGCCDLRLHLGARRRGVPLPLSAVLERFRDADAWFARALRAVVRDGPARFPLSVNGSPVAWTDPHGASIDWIAGGGRRGFG